MRPALLLTSLLLAAATATAADLRLYVFDCGRLAFDDVSAFGISNDETPVRELFVPCYLIEHRGDTVRRLLFDAGLPQNAAGRGEVELEPGTRMRYDRSLADQLDGLGLAPEDIDYVAFSHLHFDHVGSAALFTGSTLLIQDTEYQAGFVGTPLEVYVPELYLGLADANRQVLDGDHDVFGDGRVRLIRSPGHTPGHQALLVRLAETGPVLLSGDMYHFRVSRRLRRVPAFNTDRQQTLASMDVIESLLKREGATLWIEHDQALAETLRKAPEFYD